MRQSLIIPICAALGLMFAAGCATPSYDEDPTRHMDFVGRQDVAKMANDEIRVTGAPSMAEMRKQRKMMIAISVDTISQAEGFGSSLDVGKLNAQAQSLAEVFLARAKAYKLVSVSHADVARTMKTGDEINGIDFPFLVDVKLSLTTKLNKARTEDVWEHKCVLTWKLIDNRTTINGLGDNQLPTVTEGRPCMNVAVNRMSLSVGGKGFAGDARDKDTLLKNAQEAFNVAIANCLSQFYAQLAKRVPFGGVVMSLKALDGNVSAMVKGDAAGQGIVPKMQMLILNEDQDRIAVGEVLTSANGKSSVKIWRWLSPSYRKQIEDVTEKGKAAAEAWLDENPLDALCMGVPPGDKDDLLDFRSRK